MAGAFSKAHAEQRTVLFVDESAFYLLPGVVRTYAPRGQTPTLRVPLTRDHLSAISAITPDGRLFLHVQHDTIRSAAVVHFLQQLLRQIPGKLLVIWDGSPIDRSQTIKTFLADGAAHRLHLERLPQSRRNWRPQCEWGVAPYQQSVRLDCYQRTKAGPGTPERTPHSAWGRSS